MIEEILGDGDGLAAALGRSLDIEDGSLAHRTMERESAGYQLFVWGG